MALRKWNIDAWRYQIEQLPPADYLQLSYYQRWLHINEQLLVKHGLITREELAKGEPEPNSPKAIPTLTPAAATSRFGRGLPSSRDPEVAPQFEVGQHVRARNINPTGHTRLPRYARGKMGTIARDHGVYTFPDSNAHFQGEKRQHVYSVRFVARELWGEQASPLDSIYLDLWDDYLEHA
jgi:nitrile hydratase